MSGPEIEFTVFDDCGILSLIDCASYVSFLSKDWTYESIVDHFKLELGRRSMLIWECGDGGGPYSVRVRMGLTDERGFRDVVGPITVTKDRLQLVSYDALTMAAQFAEYGVPSEEEAGFAIPLASGKYKVRIIQTFDPEQMSEPPAPNFIIEIEPGDLPSWSSPAWFSV